MKKILIIGIDPHTIDFSDPEISKGLSIEKIEKGTNDTLEKLNATGYMAEVFLVASRSADLNSLAKQIKEQKYDGIVVGNGIRGMSSNFLLFERIINLIHETSPQAKIIFNSLPTDTDEAIKRWL